MLKFLKSVAIRFNPADPAATSARELLQRVGSASARKSNPDCDVSFRVLEGRPPAPAGAGGNEASSSASSGGGAATVALEFSDGERRELRARDYTVADFVKVIEEKATAMELKQVLTECKFDPEAAAAAEEAERQRRRKAR
jgi:hypothetical protein